MGDLHVLHWRVGPFRVATWYSPLPGDELLFDGALCDCDRWEEHQKVHPSERSCPHIDLILGYVAAADATGITDPSLLEEDVDMTGAEWRAAPPVEAARVEEERR